VFELLAQYVLPAILKHKHSTGCRDVRIWSAGCAGGQEAYSLAALLHRALEDELPQWRPLIFGTDIDNAALAAAAAGVYRREDFRFTQLGILDRYFHRRDGGYAVGEELRRLVRFSRDDLTRPDRVAPVDSVFGGFDLVLCRNLLIYLTQPKQREVMAKLYRSLVPGGYLILGDAESLPESFEHRLAAFDVRNRIFSRKEQDIRG